MVECCSTHGICVFVKSIYEGFHSLKITFELSMFFEQEYRTVINTSTIERSLVFSPRSEFNNNFASHIKKYFLAFATKLTYNSNVPHTLFHCASCTGHNETLDLSWENRWCGISIICEYFIFRHWVVSML